MRQTCHKCERSYNDEIHSTVCPHCGIGFCAVCDCIVCICDKDTSSDWKRSTNFRIGRQLMARDREHIDPVILRRMEANCRDIGQMIGSAVQLYGELDRERIGFALMVFAFDGPEFTWISNADRDDMIRALEEFIVKYKSGEATQTSTGKN